MPRPWVMERSRVAYSNISPSGTWAATTRAAAPLEHPSDLPAPRREVAHDLADEALRDHHLDVHDRLEQAGPGLGRRRLHGHGPGDLEGHLAGVDLVEGAVEEADLDVDQRDSRPAAPFCMASLTPRSVGATYSRGMVPPDDLVLPDEALARGRLDPDQDVAVLAVTAGLPDEAPARLDRRGDRLPVGDLRAARRSRSTWNSRRRRSTRISRCSSPIPEMRVCPVSSCVSTRKVGSSSDELVQAERQLVLVGLGRRLDGDLDDRLGEDDPLEDAPGASGRRACRR